MTDKIVGLNGQPVKKENAGVIKALLRECDAKFSLLSEDLEKIASDVFHS